MARSSGGLYSWEARAHAWEAPSAPAPHYLREGFWDESDEESQAPPSPAESGHELVSFLLALHYEGKLSARSLCVICHHAHLAGAQGPVAQYALAPESASGHFQRKLDAATGVKMSDELAWRYVVDMPGHAKGDAARTTHPTVVNVPHEALHQEVANDPSILAKIARMEWPPLYHRSTIVQRSRKPVLPLAVYLDGAPTTRRDGVLG